MLFKNFGASPDIFVTESTEIYEFLVPKKVLACQNRRYNLDILNSFWLFKKHYFLVKKLFSNLILVFLENWKEIWPVSKVPISIRVIFDNVRFWPIFYHIVRYRQFLSWFQFFCLGDGGSSFKISSNNSHLHNPKVQQNCWLMFLKTHEVLKTFRKHFLIRFRFNLGKQNTKKVWHKEIKEHYTTLMFNVNNLFSWRSVKKYTF